MHGARSRHARDAGRRRAARRAAAHLVELRLEFAERIEAAKRDWREQRFPPVPGDPERIPLPDESLPGTPPSPAAPPLS